MSLKEKGQAMLDNIASMRKLREQQEELYKELEQIAQLMLQDINPKDIEKTIYDPKLDKRRQKTWEVELPPILNVVVLKDGSRKELIPPLPRLKIKTLLDKPT